MVAATQWGPKIQATQSALGDDDFLKSGQPVDHNQSIRYQQFVQVLAGDLVGPDKFNTLWFLVLSFPSIYWKHLSVGSLPMISAYSIGP